jgi:hypothetical protein
MGSLLRERLQSVWSSYALDDHNAQLVHLLALRALRLKVQACAAALELIQQVEADITDRRPCGCKKTHKKKGGKNKKKKKTMMKQPPHQQQLPQQQDQHQHQHQTTADPMDLPSGDDEHEQQKHQQQQQHHPPEERRMKTAVPSPSTRDPTHKIKCHDEVDQNVECDCDCHHQHHSAQQQQQQQQQQQLYHDAGSSSTRHTGGDGGSSNSVMLSKLEKQAKWMGIEVADLVALREQLSVQKQSVAAKRQQLQQNWKKYCATCGAVCCQGDCAVDGVAAEQCAAACCHGDCAAAAADDMAA